MFLPKSFQFPNTGTTPPAPTPPRTSDFLRGFTPVHVTPKTQAPFCAQMRASPALGSTRILRTWPADAPVLAQEPTRPLWTYPCGNDELGEAHTPGRPHSPSNPSVKPDWAIIHKLTHGHSKGYHATLGFASPPGIATTFGRKL